MQSIQKKNTCREKLRNSRRRMIRFFRGYLEVAGVALAGLIIPRISRRAERRLATAFGQLAFIFGRASRRIGLANLDIVYGDTKTVQEKKAILRASFRHMALVILDYFWFSRHTSERISAHCRGGDEIFERWISGDFAGVFVTAHVGNWELAGQYVMNRGRELWSVYRPIGTVKTLKALLRFRGMIGQQLIARKGAMIGMLRALRKKGLVAILLDQHTDVRDGGIYLDFFGLPAAFSSAIGILANHQSVPVCVAYARHEPATDTYRIIVYDEISSEEAKALTPEAITERIVAAISKMILDVPEQWLWAYRRWKRYLPEADASRFPFYAKQDPGE